MTVIARIVTTVLYLTLLMGCASQTFPIPLSNKNPANPNAQESAFSPRPNLLQAEIPVTAEQPVAEPTPPTYLSITAPTTIFTCPMHPEVLQSSLGRCSKCGMRLVPAEPP